MSNYKKSHHDRLQRRVLIGVIIVAIIGAAFAIPLMVNDDLRYNLAMRTGQLPGQSVEQLAEGDDGTLLVVLPLDNDEQSAITPWLFKAQFIAWPTPDGIDLENIETGDRATLPVDQLEFISANADGSLVLIRGHHVRSRDPVAFTVEPADMEVGQLPDPDAVPDAPGDWETSVWDKQVSWCHRPSPNKRFIACFVPSDLASYAAGDWQLNVQLWGDYHEQHPIFRGQGLLPFVGFSDDDTVMYFQNERGIWRAEIPGELLRIVPAATPLATPRP